MVDKKNGNNGDKIIVFVLTGLIMVFLQVLFIFADTQDTPTKAAIEFTKAYLCVDRDSMDNLLSNKAKVVNDVNILDKYINNVSKEAQSRGFGLNFYTKEKIYDVETKIISSSHNKAKIRLIGVKKSPLRAFFASQYEGKSKEHDKILNLLGKFTGESSQTIDEVIDLVKEDGKWKVSESPFSFI